MKRTIKNLWHGNVAPGPNCGVGDPEIEKLIILMERHKEMLNRQLVQPQKAVWEKYADCAEEYAGLISERAFRDGFCLASRLVAESLF